MPDFVLDDLTLPTKANVPGPLPGPVINVFRAQDYAGLAEAAVSLRTAVGRILVVHNDTPGASSPNYVHTIPRGTLVIKETAVAGAPVGWVCISSGTVGSYSEGRTATSAGGSTLTLSGVTSVIRVGDRLLINGVTNVTVQAVSSDKLTLTMSGTVPAGSGLSIAYVAPTFATFGMADGGAGDSTGTPGNATLNTRKGFVAIAAGASSVTITNSLVAAGGKVGLKHALQSLDPTLTSIISIVANPAGGEFTIYGNANATAACQVYFELE